MSKYVIGIDFGSNSGRAVVIDPATGRELATAVSGYPGAEQGVYTDPAQPLLARQDPADYLFSLEHCVRDVLQTAAKNDPSFSPDRVIGIGVDTTGSTPLPMTADLRPVNTLPEFRHDLNAFAWMWKDHTAHEEAAQITRLAAKIRPQYLTRCGGAYSSEWFWAKILHCRTVAPKVFAAADTWLEFCDFIPAVLCGIHAAGQVKRSVCAAGHKAMYSAEWGGLPDADFLAQLHPDLAALHGRLYTTAYAADTTAGHLAAEWARKLGLSEGLPVAVGAFDCHFGAVGVGIGEATLVKIIGTSSCDIMVSPATSAPPEIQGVCGIVNGSVLPGWYGIEAGQSAVGDIFNWFARKVCLGDGKVLGELTKEAETLLPGQSGLLALDWHNGNRCVLVDQKLSGLILGLTLLSSRAEIYRALVEATAFGARKIVDRIEENKIPIRQIVCSGGIAQKSPLLMQIYADVMNRDIAVSDSDQACAVGGAVFAAVVAGPTAGGYADVGQAQRAICRANGMVYHPIPAHVAVYERLFKLYSELHDSFGIAGTSFDHAGVMKELMAIRTEVSGNG